MNLRLLNDNESNIVLNLPSGGVQRSAAQASTGKLTPHVTRSESVEVDDLPPMISDDGKEYGLDTIETAVLHLETLPNSIDHFFLLAAEQSVRLEAVVLTNQSGLNLIKKQLALDCYSTLLGSNIHEDTFALLFKICVSFQTQASVDYYTYVTYGYMQSPKQVNYGMAVYYASLPVSLKSQWLCFCYQYYLGVSSVKSSSL